MVSPGRGRRGFALVAALWLLVITGAVAAALIEATRAERAAAANARATSQAAWAARGALALALDSLDRVLRGFRVEPGWPGSADTILAPIAFPLPDAGGRAVILDARARVNVNTADSADLARLMTALGAAPFEAAALAARILDWRDADAAPRALGAEAGEYADRPGDAPADTAFADASDLRAVLGMPESLYRALAPVVTTFGDGRVNLNTAPEVVLAMLPGMDAASAAMVARLRARRPLRAVYEVGRVLRMSAAQLDSLRGRTAFFPRDVEVVATGSARGLRGEVRVVARVELLGGVAWRVREIRSYP